MDVTVVVATFGDPDWKRLGIARAASSALAQEVPVVCVHRDTLHEARNDGLAKVKTEWVCYLDADDELERGYFDIIGQADADIRVPAVRYVIGGTPQADRIPTVAGHTHECDADCLTEGNWIVIGAVTRTDLIRRVGGWHDYPVYEDYDLWVRCWLAGATIDRVPEAVYRAHVRTDSRNRGSLTREAKHAVHQDIARANGVKVPA